MDYTTHPVWVANATAGSRKETAVLLVGTAREFGIPQREIASTQGGFFVTERLADLIYEDSETDAADETEQDESPDTNASGNRAGKNEQE